VSVGGVTSTVLSDAAFGESFNSQSKLASIFGRTGYASILTAPKKAAPRACGPIPRNMNPSDVSDRVAL